MAGDDSLGELVIAEAAVETKIVKKCFDSLASLAKVRALDQQSP
jgi:hypothetical protein